MSHLRPLLVASALLSLGAASTLAGCSIIAGVDFGDAREATTEGGTGEGEEGGVAEVPDAAPTGCKADQVLCNGACVSKSDPAYGCGAASCVPCSVPFGKAAVCRDGVCAPDGCAAGRDDCDKNPANGCEADLTSPASCGSCGTKCGGATPFCSPTGCVATCPMGTTPCGQSCLDTKTNPDNCGGCGTKCNAPANGDPACNNGTCGFACRTGFGDCTNNPAKSCDPLPKWYRDQDSDGFGGSTSVQACTAPAGHVAKSGDCLDTNAQVFPGQPAFFGTSFLNAAGLESYDYDCSGVEVEQGAEHWPGSCGALCEAFGYTPKPARATPGSNAYCGSTSYRECIDNSILSPAVPSAAPRCLSPTTTAPAVKCR